MINILQLLALLLMLQGSVSNEYEVSYTEIYPIQDLSMVTPDYTDAPTLDLPAALQRQNPLRERQNNIVQSTKNEQALIDIIESTIEPEAWSDGTASIRLWNHNLIISAPRRIHELIK